MKRFYAKKMGFGFMLFDWVSW